MFRLLLVYFIPQKSWLCSNFVGGLDGLTADIAHRLEMVHIMLQRLQCNVFMLSYRGYAYDYSLSEGFQDA